MACFLVNISGLSGGTYDAQDHKFGLSKLLAATWTDIVKRPMPCSVLVELSRQTCGSILSKGNLLPCSIPRHAPATWTDIKADVLFSSSGTMPRLQLLGLSKGKLLSFSALRRIPVTLFRKTRVDISRILVTLFYKNKS